MLTKTAISFTVPAIPTAQPRPKATTINGYGRIYQAEKSHPIHDYKASVRLAASQVHTGAPLEGPLRVDITCIFPSKSKHRKYKATKPDADNLAKSTLDALNGRLFRDDGQVVSLSIDKWHAAKDEQPHVDVRVICLEE